MMQKHGKTESARRVTLNAAFPLSAEFTSSGDSDLMKVAFIIKKVPGEITLLKTWVKQVPGW